MTNNERVGMAERSAGDTGGMKRENQRGATKYCGTHERHERESYLAVEKIDHMCTKTQQRQTNGICGGLAGQEHNVQRFQQGRWCCGTRRCKHVSLAKEKILMA